MLEGITGLFKPEGKGMANPPAKPLVKKLRDISDENSDAQEGLKDSDDAKKQAPHRKTLMDNVKKTQRTTDDVRDEVHKGKF